MDSSRTSLPNVDRADSRLFKRYLDEQHKSVIKSNNYQQIPCPINSNIQTVHTHQQQQDIYRSKLNNSSNQAVGIKRKYSNGRKLLNDPSKQRISHTSRFMKQFQRQSANREKRMATQKYGRKPLFEFHHPSNTKETRTNQETHCTCLISSDSNPDPHSPTKPTQVPRLSLNELFRSSSEHQRRPKQGVVLPPLSPPKPARSQSCILLPAADKSAQLETVSNLIYPYKQNSPSIEPPTAVNTKSQAFLFDSLTPNLPDEQWSIINDLLQEISTEMNDKPNLDMLLEIEESLAQRIYDCIVEHNDENENDAKSYSAAINDSSPLSPTQLPLNNIVSHESDDMPSSSISTNKGSSIDNREKYFIPIREQSSSPFDNLPDRNQHSTSFNQESNQTRNHFRSPFTQSLFEPVNLLRTVTTGSNDDNDVFNFFPSSFSFETHQNIDTDFTLFQRQCQSKSELSMIRHPHSLPFSNHLLLPRATLVDTNISAFKPIDPAYTRSAPFILKRSQFNDSIGTNRFERS